MRTAHASIKNIIGKSRFGLYAIGSGTPVNCPQSSQLARYAGVHVETIRFYQRRRLIKAPPRPRGGVRRYGAADVARVRFIKAAQRIGFDLREISELLKLDDGTYCAEARTLAEKKLADVHERVTDLRSIETVLKRLVNECRSRRGSVSCPLIASLQNSGLGKV